MPDKSKMVTLDAPIVLPDPIETANGRTIEEITEVKPAYTIRDLATAREWADGDPVLMEIYLWGGMIGVNPEDLADASGLNYWALSGGLSGFTQAVR